MNRTFDLRGNDNVIILQKTMEKFPNDYENIINKFLRAKGENIAVNEITKLIPVSNRKKKHAKTSKWFTLTQSNLAFSIKNASKFYYLKFVNEGSSTSAKNPKPPFFSIGGNKANSKIVDGIFEQINKI